MNDLARIIDEIRALLALVQRRAVLRTRDERELGIVRGALLFYRSERFPSEAVADLPDPVSNIGLMLSRAERSLEALAAGVGNTRPQLRMLRGCLEKVRRVARTLEPHNLGASAAFDWRAAQMPTGDRV